MTKVHILSDVDGTITKGSLVLDHAAVLFREGFASLETAVLAWEADKKNETLISQLGEAYRFAIAGKTVEELKIDEYLEKVVSESNFYSTIDRLIEARNNGHDVTLISGSPSYLVERFANHYGFTGVGTDYHVDELGALTGDVTPMFHATAKREYVASMSLDGVAVHAYGDTQSDAPLFEVAEYRVLVQPTEETHEALKGMVDEVIYT